MSPERLPVSPEQPTYSAAVQDVLKRSGDARHALMIQFHLEGADTTIRDHFVGGAVGPTGAKEVQFTKVKFETALSAREAAFAREAEQMLQTRPAAEVQAWLEARLNALHDAVGTVLAVTAVKKSVAEGESKDQTLDATEILHYLDEATLLVSTMRVEDFLTETGQRGHLPQVLERIEQSKIDNQDRLQPDDYIYVISLVQPLEWSGLAKSAETGTFLSSQQMGESLAFGLAYAHMTEAQRMTLCRTLVDQKPDVAVDTVLALAQTGVLEPVQAKALLEYAQQHGLQMPAADMDAYVAAQMPQWAKQATELRTVMTSFDTKLGDRIEGRYAMGKWGKLLSLLGGIWGTLEFVFNTWANGGKVNDLALAGLTTATASAEILTNGGVSRGVRALIEKPGEADERARDVLRDMAARRPETLDFFTTYYGPITAAVERRKIDKKSLRVALDEIGTINPQLEQKMLDEFEGTPEEKRYRAEVQLTAVYVAAKERLNIPDESGLRQATAQTTQALGIS